MEHEILKKLYNARVKEIRAIKRKLRQLIANPLPPDRVKLALLEIIDPVAARNLAKQIVRKR